MQLSLGAFVCLYRVRVNIHLFELSEKTEPRKATVFRGIGLTEKREIRDLARR